MKKAKLAYNSGLEIILPKQGNAPMLFLEFIAQINLLQRRAVKFRVTNTNYQDGEGLDDVCFKMKLESETAESANQILNYINANL